jgi:hypothetical protein
MTEPIHPVAASDAVISALSQRRDIDRSDPLLRSLQAWVEHIDAQPLAPWTRPLPPVARTASGAELARRVAALTVVLTLSSSGLAMAVSGDPLSPLHFVKREFNHLQQPSGHRIPRLPDGASRGDPNRVTPQQSRSTTRQPPPGDPATALVRRPGPALTVE